MGGKAIKPSGEMLSEREALDCEILYLLESDPSLSQRELSERLGVSLGRVNYCIHALAERGWVKLKRFQGSSDKRRYVYVLTPGGLAHRARLAHRFLQRKIAEFEYLKAQIEMLKRDGSIK